MYGINVLFSSRVVGIRCRYFASDSPKKLLEILAGMPKANSARIAEAQRQRRQISKKSEKYAPSTVYLQVLGSGAKGAPNTLYLFTDQKRYLFNCGECTQRLAHEHKVKLSKLDHIFITSKTWRSIGGLPGLSLTLQDVGVPNITLHGPDGLDELYTATKRFVIMKDMNVTMAKCTATEEFEDNVLSVKYVILGNSLKLTTNMTKERKVSPERDYEEFIHDDTDYYRYKNTNKNKNYRNLNEKPKHNTDKDIGTAQKHNEKALCKIRNKVDCSVAYICTLKKRMGTLDLAKCVEMGVQPGPMLGQLKNGLDVILPSGKIILSKDVKTPDDPGPVFIVLDVPDTKYLDEEEFQPHFDEPENPPENVPVLIVHYTPPHVFQSPKYRAFMSRFGQKTNHLVLNGQNTCLGSEAVHRTQHKLHLLDPDIFPLLRDVSVPAVWDVTPPVPKSDEKMSPLRLKGLEELKNKIAFAQFQNIINLEGVGKGDAAPSAVPDVRQLELIAGRTLTMFHLRPKRELDRSAEPKLHIQEYIQETMDMDGFADSLQAFRSLADGLRCSRIGHDAKEYPKIVFLGTGSCIPSKTRNTSAIVVRIDEDRSILLDCGEGTFGQLVRFYGPKKVNAFLRTLKAIYISHLHADHHIGLIGVLQARAQALQECPETPHVPVYLLAPGQIVTWLTLYDHQFERIRGEYTLVPNQCLMEDSYSPNPALSGAALAAMGAQRVRTCLVAHCPNAFGIAIQITQQYKLTYSGDTLPCDDLVDIGANSTLLIHEATMEDELAEEARTKMHSTTTQAIDIGRRMNAQYTVLTHFSQRYARLPRLNANILHDNRCVGIAFDNMQITMSDLELLPHMYAPLQLMFAEHCVEMELKAAQRQRAREARPPHQHPGLPDSGAISKRSRDQKLHRHAKKPGSSKSLDTHTKSAPVGYRETLASRLRKENKGMTSSNTLNDQESPRIRSSSCSPSTSPRAGNRADNRRKMEQLNTFTQRWLAQTKPVDLCSTTSGTTFSMDSGSRTASRCQSAGLVSDIPSKTLNSNQPRPSPGEKASKNFTNNANKRAGVKEKNSSFGRTRSPSLPKCRDVKANYSSSIRPRSPSLSSAVKERNTTFVRPRSPSLTKCSTVKGKIAASVRPRSPSLTKCSAVKEKNAAFVRPRSPSLTKCSAVMERNTAFGRTRSPSLTKSINSSGNKPQTSPSSSVPPSTKIPTSKNTFTTRRASTNNSPTRSSSSEPKCTPSATKSFAPEKKPQPSSTPSSMSPSTKIPTPKHAFSARQASNAPSPISPNRGRPLATTLAPALVHNVIKSFKPQLEDIKSSIFLMNKKPGEKGVKPQKSANVKNQPNNMPISKPNPLDENSRKQQLEEARKKFQTKEYWYKSKYEKIEGLNWISWR